MRTLITDVNHTFLNVASAMRKSRHFEFGGGNGSGDARGQAWYRHCPIAAESSNSRPFK